MKIVSITDAGHRKRKIVMENGESFSLLARDVRLFSLREEADIDDETMTQILGQIRSACLRRCGNLLGSRDYTELRLREKLQEDLYPEEIIESAVQELREAGYLDDERYAASYLQLHAGDRSRMRIRHDLMARGVTASVIESVLADEDDEDARELEKIQIRRLLGKRGYNPDACDAVEEQKHRDYLYRKGYSAEAVRSVMREWREQG